MKITKQQLRRIVREQMEEVPVDPHVDNPSVKVVLDQMEEMSIDDLRTIWRAVADISKRKQNELKAGLKKGTRVAWIHTRTGEEVTGAVVRRGGKYVIVAADNDRRTRKKWPSSLRVLE